MSSPASFSPLRLRGLTLRNRLVVDVFPVQAGPRPASRDRLLGRPGRGTGPDPVQIQPA